MDSAVTNGRRRSTDTRRARVLPRWLAHARMIVRHRTSLRWRALRRLERLRPSVRLSWLVDPQRTRYSIWLPLVVGVLIAILSHTEPNLSGVEWLCGGLPVLCDGLESRRFLEALWQVEAGVLALVIAVALFALESLVRQRPGVTLRDYANRARITPYIMVGASGLIGIGIVLIWQPGRPPPAGAVVAGGMAFLGLLLLPVFVVGAFEVADPGWFRTSRIEDLRRAFREEIEAQALGRAARLELESWAMTKPSVSVTSQWRLAFKRNRLQDVETSPDEGTVFDLDLGRLEDDSNTLDALHVGFEMEENADAHQVILAAEGAVPPSLSDVAAVCVTRPPREDKVGPALRSLHDEGLEAIRSGSTTAMREVVDAYSEVFKARPREWMRYRDLLEGDG